MGFLINKKTKTIHYENCTLVKEYFKKTKEKRGCKYLVFKTKNAAENYFITKDKNFKYCSFCNKQ